MSVEDMMMICEPWAYESPVTTEDEEDEDCFVGLDLNSPPQMTKEQEEAMNEALLNPLLLHEIVGNLDYYKFLKACRLVNKVWKAVSSEVMLKKDCCKVIIVYDRKHRIFRRGRILCLREKGVDDQYQLKALNKILDKEPQFPCSHYEIWVGGGNLACPSIQKLFQLQGGRMKTLHLNGVDKSCGSTMKETFQQILLSQTYRVEHLKVSKFDYDWNEKELLPLLSLKTFDWGCCPRTALEVLRSAPQLELVSKCLSNSDIEVLLISGRSVSVKKIAVARGMHPLSLENFAEANGQVQSLSFDLDWGFGRDMNKVSAFCDAFEKVLESTKDSLEHLYLCGEIWTSFQIPVLTRLKTLAVGSSLCDANRVFPLDTNLSTIFPNLLTLDCSALASQDDSTWESHFPPDSIRGKFPSVSKIIISEDCTQQWMTRLLQLCPNFKNLDINTKAFGNRFKATLINVFKSWKHLRAVLIKTEEVKLKYFNLDSAVTGIEAYTCDLLLEDPANFKEGLEQLRSGPSLCDLEGLKYLSFVVDQSAKLQSSEPSLANRKPLTKPCPFSHLTALCVIRKMPELKVVVHLDYSSILAQEVVAAFEPLAPFVNFVHKPYDAQE